MLSALGLDLLTRHLPATWPALTAGTTRCLLGDRDAAGSARPLASSAAPLSCGDFTVWVPAPETPAEPGLAPIYRHAERRLVLPQMRQFVGEPGDTDPQYLHVAQWFEDALTRWRFPSEGGSITMLDHLATIKKPTEESLALLGLLIRYALLGSDRAFHRAGLTFPRLPMWLRPIGDNALAQQTARQLVLTVRLKVDDPDARQTLPTTDLRAAAYRITPAAPRDFGIDPVHTPEGADIRLLGRLGVGVTISDDRRLVVPPTVEVPLSHSTSRIPFAGNDDPRRLLMAANMQMQALALVTPEAPLVRVDSAGIDPPGTNLRVAYLAWQGLNHEDAWVLSESAARKLTATRDTTLTLHVRTIEMPPTWNITPGASVAAGSPLLQRLVVPALLTDDLATLAALPDLLAVTPLEPSPEDMAPVTGTVVSLDHWDLHTGEGVPDDVEIPDDVRAATRSLHRITIRETLPLEVGDKLANRHGHKGIVGAILPDSEMPTVGGSPAEALIDPISVLNRSNWGQLHECGVHPGQPATGTQFILRLPQIAREKATVAPAFRMRTPLRYRPQRLGEMEHWALWAHGGSAAEYGPLRADAEVLRRLLALAGIALDRGDDALTLQPLDLASTPLSALEPFSTTNREEASSKRLGVLSMRDLYDQLDSLGHPAALEFPDVLADVATPLGQRDIRWLPVLPARDRQPRRLHDGSERPHDLTLAYRRVLRLLRPWILASRKADASISDEADADEATPETSLDLSDLQQAVAQIMHQAYTLAVGRRATGQDSNKVAHLRRKVLGRRLNGSARAVVSPAGPLGLALDEIGLPESLWNALIAEGDTTPTIWLKRDPVLHRFGLLAVRPRRVSGHTIRLPASLLGPLNADFDGDTVAVFATLPGYTPPDSASPHHNAAHDLTGKALFVPGKQYVYGLSLMEESPDARRAFDAAMSEIGAPLWPEGEKNTAGRLQKWMTLLTTAGPARADWWTTLESHALAALAQDPGMELTLTTSAELPRMRAVLCGAAKNLYDDAMGLALADDFLAGRSLHRFRRAEPGKPLAFDPIAEVMVAARNAIGRFGGALRRLIFALPAPTPGDIRLAQTLTEQTTQKALSVKAGQPPVSVQAFEMQLRRLLRGELWDLSPDDDLARILEPMRTVWSELAQRYQVGETAVWLDWLRAPHELAEILAGTPIVRLPLSDVRTRTFLDEVGETNKPRT